MAFDSLFEFLGRGLRAGAGNVADAARTAAGTLDVPRQLTTDAASSFLFGLLNKPGAAAGQSGVRPAARSFADTPDNFDPRFGGTTPLVSTPADFLAAQGESALTVNDLLARTDRLVGAGGTMANTNARIRGFGANPAALATLNQVQAADRTGIQARVGETGTVEFTNDPTQAQRQYVAPDGTLTTNYEQSAQYAGGVRRANEDRAQLAGIERDRAISDAIANVNNKKTVGGARNAAAVLASLLGLQGIREQTGATLEVARGKQGVDVQNLLLNALKAQSDIGKTAAETNLLGVRSAAAGEAAKGGNLERAAAIAAGRDLGSRFQAFPDLTGNTYTRLDTRTGNLLKLTPQTQVNVQRDAKGAYVMDGANKRYLTPDELARMQK